MSSNIPVIDLGPWFNEPHQARLELCRQIGEVCHQIGFFYVINHGIEQSLSDHYMTTLKAFFDIPEAARQAIDKQNSPQFRGWEKLGSELTNNRVDYREQIDIGVDRPALPSPEPYYMALIGPNQWPAESLLPGFKQTVQDYFERLSGLSRHILGMMSLSLGLEQDHIDKVFGSNPSPYLKLIRYPKTRKQGQGVGVHKDSGFLTLLLQDENTGLEAQANDGDWHRVDPLRGSLVVNTGELLQLLTCNYFIATPHRVINRGDCMRYSSAFFYSPDLNTALHPLPLPAELIERATASQRHRSEGVMASRTEMAGGIGPMASQIKPAVFGDKYWQRWLRSYPDIAARYYPQWLD